MNTDRKVVVGIGEIFAGDHGIGKHALRILQHQFCLQGEIDFVEAGTAGADIEQLIAECSHLLILDAADAMATPGTIIECDRFDINCFENLQPLPHQIEFYSIMLSAVNDCGPLRVHFIGIQPASMSIGFDLSSNVEHALPEMVQRAASVLHSWTSVEIPVPA